jgi:hypothetical protein
VQDCRVGGGAEDCRAAAARRTAGRRRRTARDETSHARDETVSREQNTYRAKGNMGIIEKTSILREQMILKKGIKSY